MTHDDIQTHGEPCRVCGGCDWVCAESYAAWEAQMQAARAELATADRLHALALSGYRKREATLRARLEEAERERDEAGVLLDTIVFLTVEDYRVVDLEAYQENAGKIANEAIAFTFRPWVVEAVRKAEDAENERLLAPDDSRGADYPRPDEDGAL